MYALGFDIGSSSVKVNLVNLETQKSVSSAFSPKKEMEIQAEKHGWAEQSPDMWYENLKIALNEVLAESKIDKGDIKSIGISYQMHGLVAIDKDRNVVRPSIIWCDSRAVEIGNKSMLEIGTEKALSHLLNSPGNFTASKLKWVKDNQPEIFSKIDKIMLPGDYIAMRLTGEITTTLSGLSEGILWDFKNEKTADIVLDNFGFSKSLIPDIKETFSIQGAVNLEASEDLGIPKGIPVAYRAGDQPNNALSLNVLNPGEVAATAGTSGVVYGVSDMVKYDPKSRVNTFAHVNHSSENKRLGVLLCVNGTGILNSWIKHNVSQTHDYPEMNKLAEKINPGSDGVSILPFGNGAERLLENKNIGSHILNVDFNRHTSAHLYRAAQEGIVFSFAYGLNIMKEVGIETRVIRAGKANMFLSSIFRDTLATLTGSTIELYDTDGSKGAAIGGAIGAGIYKDFKEAFSKLEKLEIITPKSNEKEIIKESYERWEKELLTHL